MKNKTPTEKRIAKEIVIYPSYIYLDPNCRPPIESIEAYEVSPQNLSPLEELNSRLLSFGVKGGRC